MNCECNSHECSNFRYFLFSGKWESDTDMKATCKKDKVEILEYCKKVYPERDITNIVESSHFVKINNWCKLGQKKCRSGSQQWVKPYRCLGKFQPWGVASLLSCKSWRLLDILRLTMIYLPRSGRPPLKCTVCTFLTRLTDKLIEDQIKTWPLSSDGRESVGCQIWKKFWPLLVPLRPTFVGRWRMLERMFIFAI